MTIGKVEELGKRMHLTCTVGLPYAGKSQWCLEQRSMYGKPTVSPDAIRVALHGQRYIQKMEPIVWDFVDTMVEALFRAGHGDVVLDSTMINRERRQRIIQRHRDVTVVWKEFPASATECIERARAVGDEEIIPIIERMARNYEPVEDDERAGLVRRIDG